MLALGGLQFGTSPGEGRYRSRRAGPHQAAEFLVPVPHASPAGGDSRVRAEGDGRHADRPQSRPFRVLAPPLPLPLPPTALSRDNGSPVETPSKVRIASIDAFRGAVMTLMVAEVLRLPALGKAFSQSAFWGFVAFNTSHVEWQGGSLHDLIQPGFSFLVGASLPFSIANRRARGQSAGRMVAHATWRALVLVFLGIFLRSINKPQTYFTFEDTLTQIGLGYVFLFLLGLASTRVQVAALVLILAGYWALFAVYPAPGPQFDYSAVGRARGLASSLQRLPLALGQELQRRLGVRPLVPQPVPARAAVRIQRGRVRHAQLHPDPRHDAARAAHGDVAERRAVHGGQAARDDRRRHGPHSARAHLPVDRPLPHRQAHLDAGLHALQRRLRPADPVHPSTP